MLFAVRLFRCAALIAQLHAFKIILQDEVDRAGHGIGAVDRGRPAGDHVDPFEHVHGNGLGIDGAGQRERRQALAVDQNQAAIGPEATQVDRCGARGAIVDVLAIAGDGRWKVAEYPLDIRLLLELQLDFADRCHRAAGDHVGRLDTRAGDHDNIIAGVRLVLRQCRRAGGGKAQRNAAQQRFAQSGQVSVMSAHFSLLGMD